MKRFYWIALLIAFVLGAALFAIVKKFPRKQTVAFAPAPEPTGSKPIRRRPAALPTVSPIPSAAPTVVQDEFGPGFHTAQIRRFQEMPLRIAESKAKLSLDEREHELLLDEVVDFRHAAAIVDGPLIKVTSFDGTSLVLEIPAHPEQGAAVKTALVAQIRRDFAPEKAEAIVAALDTNLDGLFDGFGKFSRTYTIERPSDDASLHVTTIASVAGAAAEDADAIQKARAISGNGSFDRSALDLAYEVIVPSIDQYFPSDRSQPVPAHVP